MRPASLISSPRALLLGVLLVSNSLPSLAAVHIYSDEAAWLATVGAVDSLDTTAANITLANEIVSPPGTNAALGSPLTFPGSATGFAFDFRLRAINEDAADPGRALVYDDNERDFPLGERLISIGDIDGVPAFPSTVDTYQNDDFEVAILGGCDVYAIGITVFHNVLQAGENLQVYGAGGETLAVFVDDLPNSEFGPAFVGIVADTPISRIVFDENAFVPADGNGDDVAVRDFRFACDACPADVLKVQPAGCGCGFADDDLDGDGSLACDDCDDSSAYTYPDAPELFDGVDNDCDADVDEDLDDDGDGVPDFNDACPATSSGTGVDAAGCAVCTIDPDDDQDGFPASVDCDDSDPSVSPGSSEICDGVDQDCDGEVDEGFDVDGDGFSSCGDPVADCDDADAAVNPNAIEIPGNDVDEDCDGSLGDCDPGASWKNHGEFVRCVAQECQALVSGGLLSEDQCDGLVSQAARSAVGKP